MLKIKPQKKERLFKIPCPNTLLPNGDIITNGHWLYSLDWLRTRRPCPVDAEFSGILLTGKYDVEPIAALYWQVDSPSNRFALQAPYSEFIRENNLSLLTTENPLNSKFIVFDDTVIGVIMPMKIKGYRGLDWIMDSLPQRDDVKLKAVNE